MRIPQVTRNCSRSVSANHPADPIHISSNSGFESTAILNSSMIPEVLSFAKSTEAEEGTPPSNSATNPRPYDNLERPCRLSDDSAWVLDEKNRKVLWVPPLCRGPGNWWGPRKKLLLQGKNGRLTLVDFSHVDLDRNDLF